MNTDWKLTTDAITKKKTWEPTSPEVIAPLYKVGRQKLDGEFEYIQGSNFVNEDYRYPTGEEVKGKKVFPRYFREPVAKELAERFGAQLFSVV